MTYSRLKHNAVKITRARSVHGESNTKTSNTFYTYCRCWDLSEKLKMVLVVFIGGVAGLVFRILFVCDANTFRSPLAEFMLRKMLADRGVEGVDVRSGGVAPHARDGCMVSQDVVLLLREEGVKVPEEPFSKNLKRHRELIEGADLILTMTRKQKELVLGMDGVKGAVYTLKEYVGEEGDIEDPRMLGEESYPACKEEIKKCLEKIVEKFLSMRRDT